MIKNRVKRTGALEMAIKDLVADAIAAVEGEFEDDEFISRRTADWLARKITERLLEAIEQGKIT